VARIGSKESHLSIPLVPRGWFALSRLAAPGCRSECRLRHATPNCWVACSPAHTVTDAYRDVRAHDPGVADWGAGRRERPGPATDRSPRPGPRSPTRLRELRRELGMRELGQLLRGRDTRHSRQS
jgi:hypothetical protein